MFMLDGKRFNIYGMTPAMIQCVKNACSEFSNKTLPEILDTISNNPEFTQSEINIILFEIGRNYGRKESC